MAFGRLVSLFRKSPFMQGPLLSRVGVIMLAITPVLILLLWRFHSPSMMDADVRGAVILNDPLTATQESGFYPVVFDVDGNPRGTQSLAHVPQGSPNAGRLHRGDHVTLLCEGHPCEVVQIRQGDQVLVSGEALAEFSRYKNRMSALGLLAWALCGAGLIWLSGRRRHGLSGRGMGRRRRRSRSSGSSRPAGSSRSSSSSRPGGASRSTGSSRSGESSRPSGSSSSGESSRPSGSSRSGESSRSSGSSRRGRSSRSSGSSRLAESSRSSGASQPAESSRSAGASHSAESSRSSGSSRSSSGAPRSSGSSRPAEASPSSAGASQPSGQSRPTSADNE